tara:strand:+ start:1882 stop:2220 length:339 start_codon:yes stop_codon:yes gene_type:complete
MQRGFMRTPFIFLKRGFKMNDKELRKQYTVVNFRFKGTKKNIRWRTLSKYVSSLRSRLKKIGAYTETDYCTFSFEVENLKTHKLTYGKLIRLDDGSYTGYEKTKNLWEVKNA